MPSIELSKNGRKYRGLYTALVDEADTDLVSLCWSVHPSHNMVYVARSGEYLHRIVLARTLGRPLLPHEHVEHISRDGLDNRRTNLRLTKNQTSLPRHWLIYNENHVLVGFREIS